MKIVHKFSVTESDKDMLCAFQEMGISSKDISGIWFFQVAESDPQWEQVDKIIKKFKLRHMIHTEFASSEKKAAKYLSMIPSWHHGFPQPEDDFAYLPIVFDLKNYCSHCGAGLKKIAPFRMKTEPHWGKKSILQLNWEFDEYFVKPEVWEKIFKPMGIGSRPVLNHQTNKVLETVLQIEVTETVSLDLNNLPFEECSGCGARKYLPITKGLSPFPLETPSSNMFKSNQYFGSGGSAYNMVFISNALYSAIEEIKIKGVEFAPCG